MKSCYFCQEPIQSDVFSMRSEDYRAEMRVVLCNGDASFSGRHGTILKRWSLYFPGVYTVLLDQGPVTQVRWDHMLPEEALANHHVRELFEHRTRCDNYKYPEWRDR